MIGDASVPKDALGRVEKLQEVLIKSATGGEFENEIYAFLRRELMCDPALKDLLPEFVRSCRHLELFWPVIKKWPTYAERRDYIGKAFLPVFEYLEGQSLFPSDEEILEVLAEMDAEAVRVIWSKAMERRNSDPEGAITLARTLLETVIKRILDESEVQYSEKDDPPKLYFRVATVLNLAPNQHTQEPIKAILGGAMNLVNGIGTLRNRLSDSHGRGGKLPVRPSHRHASLAVNTAGSVAFFLVETHLEKNSK